MTGWGLLTGGQFWENKVCRVRATTTRSNKMATFQSSARHTQHADHTAQPAAQNLQQVANKVGDLAARVDELEQKADLSQPETVGTIQPVCGPNLLQDVL